MALVESAAADAFPAVRELVAAYSSGITPSITVVPLPSPDDPLSTEEKALLAKVLGGYKEQHSVNQQDPFGDTALHHAAAKGNLLLVRFLVAEGANVNTPNNAGSTPLHKACARTRNAAGTASELSVVSFLLEAGADPNIKNKAGFLPEDYARGDPALAVKLMGDSAVSVEIPVPREKHGVLIGKGGGMKEEIQMECQCTVIIPQKSDSSESVKVIGRADAIPLAKAKIAAILEESAKQDAKQNPATVAKSQPSIGLGGAKGKGRREEPELDIDPSEKVSLKYPLHRDKHRIVIGQGGKTINAIRAEAKVRITVPKPEDDEDSIFIEGTGDGVDKAARMIREALVEHSKKYGPNPAGGSRPGVGRGGSNSHNSASNSGDRRSGSGGSGARGGSSGARSVPGSAPASNSTSNSSRGGKNFTTTSNNSREAGESWGTFQISIEPRAKKAAATKADGNPVPGGAKKTGK